MSIFKESFPFFVKKQLEQREKIISSGTGRRIVTPTVSAGVTLDSTENAEFKYDKNAFFNFNESRSNEFFQYQQKQCILRLSSGVDITDPQILEENKSGAEIAKRWVLEGGIKDGNTNRGGIGTGGAYGDEALRANADDGYGIVPMPGITSANIRTKSAYGSLREAKVNFVCHNRRQLEVLELLYMRPGYTLLLEWQWSPFVDKDGKMDSTTIKKIDFFNKANNISSMEKDIESYKEETGGNYDALIGYCKNFTYKLRGDGGFDCETEIIAKGEVLESLKDKDTSVRISDSYGDSSTSRPNLEIFLADLVAFNNAAEGVGALEVNGEGSTQAEGELSSDTINAIKRNLSEELASKIGVGAPTDANDYNLSPFILTGGPESFTDWGDGLQQDSGRDLRDGDERGDWGDWEGFWSIVGGGRRFRTNTTWVRWDALCYCINKHVIPLNEQKEPIMSLTTAYLSHPDDEQKVYLEPLMYSSKKRATSFITDKITQLKAYDLDPKGGTKERPPDPIYWITDISVNNQVCMLPHNLYQYKDAPNYKILGGPNFGNDGEGVKLKGGIMKQNFHKPLVKTLVDKTSFQFKSGEDINRTWEDNSAFSQNNIGGIYFGAEYLLSTFRGMYYTSEGNINKDYTLFNFIKKIWEEVNACTQNGHDFDIQTDNRGGCSIVRIIDRQMDNSGESIKDPHVLRIQTLDSVVRDVTYNTTIPSSLSSTIAIAAQSPDSIDDLDKVSFAALNKGIKDRFSIKTTTDNTPSESQLTEWKNRFDSELIKVHGALYTGGGGGFNIGRGGALINLLYREYQSNRNYILKEDMVGMSPKNQSSFKGALKNIMSALNYFQSHYGSTDQANKTYYRGQPASDGTQPLSAVIPLKFNAQLDGISGMVIGNVFKIPKDRLPMAYGGNDINFIVMGEEQSINENQDWTTTISGHLILLGNASSEEYKKTKHYKSWKNPDLNISQNAYLDVRTVNNSDQSGQTEIGNKLAGSIVGSTLGDPLESMKVTSVFGKDRGYYKSPHPRAGEKRIHKGVDLGADSGAIAYAVADATVVKADGNSESWGGAVWLKFDANPLTGKTGDGAWNDPKHKNTTPRYALYAHMKKWWKGDLNNGTTLKVGDKVKKGETIGLTGGNSDDPYNGNSETQHLHFEFYLSDQKTKIDPIPWMPGNQDGAFRDGNADEGDGALGTNLGEKVDGGLVNQINQTSTSDAISGERRIIDGDVIFVGWPGNSDPSLLKADLNGGKFIQTGFTEEAMGGLADTGDMTHLPFGRYVKDGQRSNGKRLWIKIAQTYKTGGIVEGKDIKEIDGTEYGMMLFPEFKHYELIMRDWKYEFTPASNLKYIK